MRSTSSLAYLFALTQTLGLATGLALEPRDTCNADNCLRAVRATAYGTVTMAMRKADCQSFFSFTLTPATSISTSTITNFATVTPLTVTLTNTAGETDITTPPTETATYRSTVTNTFTPDTVTITVTITATALTTSDTSTVLSTTNPTFTTTPAEVFTTSVISTTQVVFTTVTGTITDFNIQTTAPGKRAIEARQTVRKPSLVPAYASPCSGIARYSSACLCDGVLPITTTVASPISVVFTTLTNALTAAVPVTTVTVTTTTDIATVAPTVTTSTVETDAVTVATPTSIVTTIETDTTTLPAPTTTVTITVTSTLVEPTPSTTIFSTTTVTSTSTIHETFTVHATAAVPAFELAINTGQGQPCNNQFVNTPASNNQAGSLTNCGGPTTFNLDQFGYLHFGTTSTVAVQQIPNGFQDFRFLPISQADGFSFTACMCSITGTNLGCNCLYGSRFNIEFGEIFVGPTGGTAFTPVVVPV